MPGSSNQKPNNQKSQSGLTNVSKVTKISNGGTAPATQNMQGALNLHRMKEPKYVPVNVAVGAAKLLTLKNGKPRRNRRRRNTHRRKTRRN